MIISERCFRPVLPVFSPKPHSSGLICPRNARTSLLLSGRTQILRRSFPFASPGSHPSPLVDTPLQIPSRQVHRSARTRVHPPVLSNLISRPHRPQPGLRRLELFTQLRQDRLLRVHQPHCIKRLCVSVPKDEKKENKKKYNPKEACCGHGDQGKQ